MATTKKSKVVIKTPKVTKVTKSANGTKGPKEPMKTIEEARMEQWLAQSLALQEDMQNTLHSIVASLNSVAGAVRQNDVEVINALIEGYKVHADAQTAHLDTDSQKTFYKATSSLFYAARSISDYFTAWDADHAAAQAAA